MRNNLNFIIDRNWQSGLHEEMKALLHLLLPDNPEQATTCNSASSRKCKKQIVQRLEELHFSGNSNNS